MAMIYLKDGRCVPEGMGFPNENEGSHNNTDKWISGAISHPGALTRKAHRAGESPMEFAHEHASAGGTTGKQARLAITLAKMRKH
jgi:hypothetical protein